MSIFRYLLENDNKLIPEHPEGNIEYKLRLDKKNAENIKKMESQMLWRLSEGKNQNYPIEYTFMKKSLKNISEAHYILGIYDNGNLGKLDKETLNKTVDVFKEIVNNINSEIFLEEYYEINNSHIYYVIIRTKSINIKIEEYNIIFCGEENSGKTTLIGNLCYNIDDNGNGLSRKFVLKHPHEKLSGSTTSITKEIIGINNNNIINYSESHNWEDIVKLSDKIINIFDTPGNLYYVKTIFYSLLTYQPSLLIICYKNINNSLIQFLIKYADLINIKYILIDYNNSTKDNLYIIKDRLLKLNRIKNNNYNFIESYYRITDIYNVPDRDKIVGGMQINGTIQKNINAKLISLLNNVKINNIQINTIYKKNINSDNININETGSISFNLSNIIKITKNILIVPNNVELNYINKICGKILLNLDKSITNRYIMLNGNFQFYGTVNILDDNINIECDNNIILQNNILILINYNYNISNIFNKIIIVEINK
jgi:GTPase